MDREFSGVFPYLVSPIDSHGNVKEQGLISLVEHLITSGVHGLVPLGSTGEYAYLTWEQRRDVTAIVIETASKRVPVVAGVAHTSIREASRQAKEMERLGADGILAIMDSYFPVSSEGVIAYFSSIAHAVSCPVVLYTNPSFSSANLSLDVVRELAKIPNIQYLKDASSNTGNLLTLMNQVGDKIRIFSASAHVPLFVMMMGGVGWMSGPSCVVPRQSVTLYQLAKEGRWKEAMSLQKPLWNINRIFQKYSLAPCIKACLTLQGFDVGDPIPPLLPLGNSALTEVKQVLKALNALDNSPT